jgi:hypothetical protein
MKINQDQFYKSQGFWWTIDTSFEVITGSVSEHNFDGPYCLNCYSDLVFSQNDNPTKNKAWMGIFMFGEKMKDQRKKDYSQIFLDLDDEQVRFDKSNKHPQDILASLTVEFPHGTHEMKFKGKTTPAKKQ